MARPYSIVLDGGDHLVLSLTDEGAVSQLNLLRKSGNRFPEKIMLKQRGKIMMRFRGSAS